MKNRHLRRRTYVYVGVVLASLALMALIGIYGWYSYVLPNLLRISTYSSSTIAVFAFFAGLASFFSPCVFALLPAYLSYFFTLKEGGSNPKSPLIIGLFEAFGMFTEAVARKPPILIVG